MNNGAQFAKFGGNCVNAGTIIHELGHTLCMGHEQTRLDRDKWIGFNTGVCTPPPIDGYEFQSGLNKLYDYVSVEHGEEECHNGCFQPRVPLVTHCGSGGPLSVLDIEVLNEMYGCSSGELIRQNSLTVFLTMPKYCFTNVQCISILQGVKDIATLI